MKKKTMMQRFMGFVLAGTLCASVLWGCGSGSDSTEAETAQSSKEEAPETDADAPAGNTGEKTDLVLWMPPYASGSDGDTLDLEFWTKTLEPWAKENNVNLSIEVIPWANYEEKMLTAFSSGEGPDVTTLYNEIFNDYIEMGVLEELSGYFTEEETANYLHYDMGNLKGGQYGIPYLVGEARILYCNMDILNQAGVEKMPETWEEFEQAALTIKDAGLDDVMPFAQEWGEAAIGGLNNAFWPFYWQAGGEIFDETGTALTINDNGAAVEAAEYLYRLKESGVLSDEVLSLSASDVVSLFSQGKVAMAIMGTSSAAQYDANHINWDFVDSLEGKTKAIWVAVSCMSINSASEHKELAADLIKHISSPEIMEAFHSELASYPPISKGEKYLDNEKFKEMYETSEYLHSLPVAEGTYKLCDTLLKNLQLMMMGELTPQDTIQNTIDYYNNL